MTGLDTMNVEFRLELLFDCLEEVTMIAFQAT
jgi:hypothetical protein